MKYLGGKKYIFHVCCWSTCLHHLCFMNFFFNFIVVKAVYLILTLNNENSKMKFSAFIKNLFYCYENLKFDL